MIQRTLIVVLLMLMQQSLYAQPKALSYYRTINQAELAICRKDLIAANQYYIKAFTINPQKPFTRDLLNAYYCAMDLHKYETAKQYLRRILSRGVGSWSLKEFIKKSFQGADLDSINQWMSVYPNDTVKSNDLYARFTAMHDHDQQVRTYFSEKNDGRYMVDSVFRMDNENGNEIASIFKKYGVPNEDIVGSVNQNPACGPVYEMLVSHYSGGYMNKMDCHALDTLLFKAIFTYDYPPESFARLLNRSELNVTKSAFKYKTYKLRTPLTIDCVSVWEDGTIYPEYLPPEIEKDINRQRALIGLESLNDLRQKIVFNKRNAATNSSYTRYLLESGVGSYLDAETYEQAKNKIAEFSKYKPENSYRFRKSPELLQAH